MVPVWAIYTPVAYRVREKGSAVCLISALAAGLREPLGACMLCVNDIPYRGARSPCGLI